MKTIFAIAVMNLLVCTNVIAKTIEISPANTSVFFQVAHEAGYTVGYFKEFSGVVELNDALTEVVSAKAIVKTNSIDTRNSIRDEGLKSPLFLDTLKFPQATYDNKTLTIKGKAQLLALTVEKEDNGSIILKGEFNRNDFGMKYNKNLPKKRKYIGEEVELFINIYKFL